MFFILSKLKYFFVGDRTRDVAIVLSLFLGISILFGMYMYIVENLSFVDTVYYLFATASTVGYGDISPTQPLGRMLFSVYIFVAIASFGVLIGMASERVYNISKNIKLGRIKMKRSVKLLIVGYPNEDKVLEIVEQLREDQAFKPLTDVNIVCISNTLEEKPAWFEKYNVRFIKGLGSSVDTLMLANIMDTEIALVLAQNPSRLDSDDYSSSSVAIIEKLNSKVHTIVERVRKDTLLFETSGCDVVTRISSPEVLAQEILDPGAFEFENAVFSNSTPGTQYNLVYTGEDIIWSELAIKFIFLGAIPEGFRKMNHFYLSEGPVAHDFHLEKNFELLPSPDSVITDGSIIKYRSSHRLNEI